jgi:Subtilase family
MRPRLVGGLGALALVLALGGVQHADAGTPPDPSPDLDKLDSGLLLLVEADAAGEVVSSETGVPVDHVPGSSGSITVTSGADVDAGRVLVDVYVDGALGATAGALAALGMEVSATSDTESQRMVEGWIPVGALADATALDATRAVRLVPADVTDQGTVLSQGDAAHHGPQARALGATGAGVKVGVISDSMSTVGGGLASSQSTGNLPGPASVPPGSVTILDEGDPGDIDEGRAMAEIIFDGAPGIRQMYFSDGVGAAVKAASITNLVANGVTVIADDIFAITEPFFQDGVSAQAVDAAKAAGVTYLASAGNRGRLSWEGTYTPTADPRDPDVSPTANDFDPGAGADAIQTLGTFTNTSPFLSFQWAEPWGSATTDLALDFWQISGGVPTYIFTQDNGPTGFPSEFASFNVVGSATVGVSVRRVSGTGTPFMKYIMGGTNGVNAITEYPTNSNAINPDAASATGALTVAASAWNTPTTPEAFSSRGPSVTKRFDTGGTPLGTPDVRPKPTLAAADGVATSVSTFPTFFGTSAATPSAAAIAALVRSADPTLTVDEVASILTNPANALDCTATAGQPDADCGSGFLLADRALQDVDSTPPAVARVVSPATPNAKDGWYTGSVTVTWTVTETGSILVSQSGCGPRSVTTDGVFPVTCTAKSVGGTHVSTVTIKRDASAPTKVKIKGLKKTYAGSALPDKNKVKCKAKDPTSGITKCTVKGIKLTKGTHTAKATAINGAGLKSKATFTYTIT